MSIESAETVDFGQKLIITILGGFGVTATAVLTFLASRGKIKIERGSALVEQYDKFVKSLQAERDAMQEERTAFALERKEWVLERADMRARMLACEGHNRGIEQYIYSLEALLRSSGIQIPVKRQVVPIVLLESDCDTHGKDLTDGG